MTTLCGIAVDPADIQSVLHIKEASACITASGCYTHSDSGYALLSGMLADVAPAPGMPRNGWYCVGGIALAESGDVTTQIYSDNRWVGVGPWHSADATVAVWRLRCCEHL